MEKNRPVAGDHNRTLVPLLQSVSQPALAGAVGPSWALGVGKPGPETPGTDTAVFLAKGVTGLYSAVIRVSLQDL